MFVALQAKDRTRVTSIASQWDERLEVLRELTSGGHLICPGCEQRLWLRIGIKRRRHFAHRHLADCPLGNQSAEVLEAKAQMFEWLEKKYPGKVNLDLTIGVPGWSKVIDLLVEAEPGRKFAYWIIDRQQRSREEIIAYQGLPGVHVHFVHTQSTLVSHSKTTIALTASQRDFIGWSDYDACIGPGGRGHLHFLDEKHSKVCIFRGLWCVHGPNLYAWEALRTDLLSAARISPKTGEIVLAEDLTARKKWKEKLKQDEKAAAMAHSHAQPTSQETVVLPPVLAVANHPTPVTDQEPAAAPLLLGRPLRCEDCGIETTDWSVATPSAGTCVCRKCVKERWRQKTASQTKI